MRVTLALLTWNHAAAVDSAINSLRAQDYSDLEILVQDDGSTDNTLSVARIAAKNDPRVRVMTTERNIGSWANLALAAERATGDFISWACPGDEWAPNFTSELVAGLTASPDAVAVMCGTIDFDEETREECGRRAYGGRFSPEAMGWFQLASAVLFKTRPEQMDRPHYSLILHGLMHRRTLLHILDAYRGLGPILNERGVISHLALVGPFTVCDKWLFRKESHRRSALERAPHAANRIARSDPHFHYSRTCWQMIRAMLRSRVIPNARKLTVPLVVGRYFVVSVADMVLVWSVSWLNRHLPRGFYRSIRAIYRLPRRGRQGAEK